MQVEIFDMKTQMNRIESLIDEMAIDYSDTNSANTVNYN